MAPRSKPISMLPEFLDSLEDPRGFSTRNQAQGSLSSSATGIRGTRTALHSSDRDHDRCLLAATNHSFSGPTSSSNIEAEHSQSAAIKMEDHDSDTELPSATIAREIHGMTIHPLNRDPNRYFLTAPDFQPSGQGLASTLGAKQPEDSHAKTEDNDSNEGYDDFNEAVRYSKQREELQIQRLQNASHGELFDATPSMNRPSTFRQQIGSSAKIHQSAFETFSEGYGPQQGPNASARARRPMGSTRPNHFVRSQREDDMNWGFDPPPNGYDLLPINLPVSEATAQQVRSMPHIDLWSLAGNTEPAQESHAKLGPSRVRHDRNDYYTSTVRPDGSHGLSQIFASSAHLGPEVEESTSLGSSSPNATVLPGDDDDGDIKEHYNELMEEFNYRRAVVLPKEKDNSDGYHETMDEFKNRLIHLLGQMMFVSGEQAEPSPETTWMIEEIVREQVLEMLKEASALANRRGSKSISIVDLIFQIRHNPAKVSRLKTFLSWKDVRKNVKDSDDKAGADADALDLEEGALPGANPAAPQKTSTNRKAKLILPWEVQSFYNETVPEREDEEDEEEEEQNEATLARLASADERTKNMTREEYVYWSDCRQASFTFRKGKRFREWAGFGTIIDSKPNDDVVDILGFLTFEIVQTLTEEALKVKAAEDIANKKASGLRGDVEANKRRKREGCTLFEMVEEDKTPVEPKHVREAFRRLQIVPKKYTFMRQGYAGVRTPLRMI